MPDDKKLEQEITKKTKRAIYIFSLNALFLLLAIIVVSVVFYYFNANSIKESLDIKNKESSKNTANTAEQIRRKIDGIKVDSGHENSLPVAVMIDNHPDARPPAGLSKARLVYEAEVEGGITRYLAIFLVDDELDSIGPVRSARPYFIEWAKELSSIYVHVGGSPDALAKMTKEKIFHMNEFYQGEYFWRSENYDRPHNVFISSANIRKFLDTKPVRMPRYFSWQYKEEAPLTERPDKNDIKINFILHSYKVEWRYDKTNNNYIRYLAGNPHVDDSNNIITAKNIIIQYIPAIVTDDKLRLDMNVLGDGRAVLCSDGICQPGSWRKDNTLARTRFYLESGEEASFNPGISWIEVLRPEREVEY